jgi:hypothetical protein
VFPTLSTATYDGRFATSSAAYWYVPTVALAAACGAAIALGGTVKLILAFGIGAGLVLLFTPVQFVLGLFFFTTLLVVGPLTSVADAQKATWVPYILGFVMMARAPMELYWTSRGRNGDPAHQSLRGSLVTRAVAFYLAIVILSGLVNLIAPLQALFGAKFYVFIWGFFFLLLASSISPELLERTWRWILVVALLQFPFALYQRIFEVGRRARVDSSVNVLDAIVGTFPGTEGGGASGALVVFCVFSIAMALALRQEGTLSARFAVVIVVTSLFSIALGEVKAILVYIPLAFLVFRRRDVAKRPLWFMGTAVIVGLLVIGTFSLYQDASRAGQNRSTWEHVEASFGYVLDPTNMNPKNGGVGRMAALALWYQDGRRTPTTFLLGYGPSASHSGSAMIKGPVALRYAPYHVNSTTAATMLWDTGVLGLASLVIVLCIAFVQATRLSGARHVPAFHRGVLEACAVLFALIGVSLPYNSDALAVPQYQVLFLLALFQVVYWGSRQDVAGP